MLEGDRWSYREFSPPLPGNRGPAWNYFAGLDAVEGAAGEVYLWSHSDARHVLWVHDGAAWTNHTPADLPAWPPSARFTPSRTVRSAFAARRARRQPSACPAGRCMWRHNRGA